MIKHKCVSMLNPYKYTQKMTHIKDNKPRSIFPTKNCITTSLSVRECKKLFWVKHILSFFPNFVTFICFQCISKYSNKCFATHVVAQLQFLDIQYWHNNYSYAKLLKNVLFIRRIKTFTLKAVCTQEVMPDVDINLLQP